MSSHCEVMATCPGSVWGQVRIRDITLVLIGEEDLHVHIYFGHVGEHRVDVERLRANLNPAILLKSTDGLIM